MKKRSRLLIIGSLSVLVVLSAVFILNLNVFYYQGVDYNVKRIKIPLYLKIVDLFSRHYHYKELVREITKNCKSEEEKISTLFNWTHENIRDVPLGFPIIDDHAWHIIIRGYGTADQSSDVFTILCNYAGIEAFLIFVSSKQEQREIPLSLVKMDGRWFIFDPFRGVCFEDDKGNWADIEMVKSGLYSLGGRKDRIEIDYSEYISNLPSVKHMGLRRANTQSPINRLLYEIQRVKNKYIKRKALSN